MDKKSISYNEEIYKEIPMRHLIVFGMHSLIQRGEKCTFEKLVEECFNSFPKMFSFSRHPKWPDSLKFDRQLRSLRERGLIVGNSRTLFTLTKFGETITNDTAKILRVRFSKRPNIEKTRRDVEINWIHALKDSEVFQQFLKEKNYFSITDMELRNLLHCTLETPLRIVKQNLTYSINLAKALKEKKLLKFLELCQQKLSKNK